METIDTPCTILPKFKIGECVRVIDMKFHRARCYNVQEKLGMKNPSELKKYEYRTCTDFVIINFTPAKTFLHSSIGAFEQVMFYAIENLNGEQFLFLEEGLMKREITLTRINFLITKELGL